MLAGPLEPGRPKGPSFQAAPATGPMNANPSSLSGTSALATWPHSPESQEAGPSWVIVTAPPIPPTPHVLSVGPSTEAGEGSEFCPATTTRVKRQKALQSWGGGDLTQGSFLEEAAYTWTPHRQMKGQCEQDPEAGASLAPED